jgi:CBS domain-containing protein
MAGHDEADSEKERADCFRGRSAATVKIKQFYRPEIFKARVEDSLLEAAAHMDDHQVGALAVFEGDSLIGMISERDLVRAMAQGADPKGATVAEYMSLRILTADEEETSAEVAQRMLDAGIRHLPVLKHGQAVGTISIRDVLALELWGPPGAP